MSQYSNSITHGFWISMKSYISSLILVAKLDSHQWNCAFIHFNRFEEWIYASREKSRNTDFVIDSSSNQKLLQDVEIYCNDWSFWVIIIEGIFENFCKNLFLEPKMDIFFTNNEHIFKAQYDFSPRSSDRGVIWGHKTFQIVKSILSSLNRTFNW